MIDDRREVCRLQAEFCEKQFSDIKATIHEHGDEIKHHGEMLKNGISHRLKRVEWLMWTLIAGGGVFILKEALTKILS